MGRIDLPVFEIEEKDILYRNPNAGLSLRALKPFLPPETKKTAILFSWLISKIFISQKKEDFKVKKWIDAHTTIIHGRSASIPARFRDRYGNIYNYVNFKGIGQPYYGGFGPMHPGGDLKGLVSWRYAHRDQVLSDMLLEYGFRTSIVLYIVKLRQLPGRDGKLHPVEALVRGSKKEENTPVVITRGMRCFFRIGDLCNSDSEEKKDLLAHVIHLLKDEGFEIKNREEYLLWFTSTIAKQLSILYEVRARHGYLTEHNITLAAEIVDFDSMTSRKLVESDKQTSLEEMLEDVNRANDSIKELASALRVWYPQLFKDLRNLLLRSYFGEIIKKNFKNKNTEELKKFIDEFNWFENSKITNEMFLAIDEGYECAEFMGKSIKKRHG